MESGLFENYEQEFNTLFSSIANKINIIVPSQSGEKKKEILRGLEREFREADEVLGQMEVELHSLPAQARAKLQPRLRGYKTEIEKQRKEFRKASSGGGSSADREVLLAGSKASTSPTENDYGSDDQRSRLLAGTERLTRASDRLSDTHRIAIETEEIGNSVLSDLRRQREQIEKASDNLREADTYLDRSNRLIKGMARRMATNKLITFLVIIVLVSIIGLIIYWKVK